MGVYGGIVGVPGDLKPSPQELGLGTTVNWVVGDLDKAAAKVVELGGSKALDKTPAGTVGTFMQFRDPHGNRFALFQKA
ncbi:hypothetical protein HII31_11543 [Pseudocercospora fuligena]|uniref:VOC domain-containing protein n=1 Tax=Pseudocercospora fuligena TaxID=685502 RepID=A0A8H6RB24_9PEZI|nr:hypothetical protein HII31_11543 [Pseudocercospora fuligena]